MVEVDYIHKLFLIKSIHDVMYTPRLCSVGMLNVMPFDMVWYSYIMERFSLYVLDIHIFLIKDARYLKAK